MVALFAKSCTRVFPALRRYCEERDVTLFELDLRWGISEEESKQGKVVDICLKEIQNTRPFFIGLLGERYGWTPSEGEQEAIVKNTAILEEYPWIQDEFNKGTSITEIEIHEGVLRSKEKVDAYFYFRSSEMAVPDTDEFKEKAGSPAEQKLQNLKGRIREKKEYPVKEYNSIEELGQLVEKDFKELVDSLFPEGAISELEKERLEQKSYLKSKTGVYIPISGYENKLDDFIQGNKKTLVITGPRGMGKSAFLADWIVKRQENPTEGLRVLYHFIGASRSEGDYHKITQRLIDEVTDIYGAKNEAGASAMPDTLIEHENKDEDGQTKILQDLLFAVPWDNKLVIILDGADKLDEADNAKLLNWLPAYPENVKFIFSSSETDTVMDVFKRNEYPLIAISSLDVEHRKRLIAAYLLPFHKNLSSAQIERIAKDDECENPLVLRSLLEEIRLFGIFEKLDAEIDRYLAADSIPSFFALVLGRMEAAFKGEQNIVKDILSLISVSRNGLAEEEILELSGAAPLYWSQIYSALGGHISARSGLVAFAHPFIKDAVKREWLNTTEAENAYRTKIAAYMKTGKALPDRRNREYPFQLYELQDWDVLYAFLLDFDVFQSLYKIDEYELGKYWRSLKEVDGNKYSPEKYLAVNTADKDKKTLDFVYLQLGYFLREITADLELSLEFFQKALAICEEVFGKNHPNTAIKYNNIGLVYNNMGKYPKALEFLQKALVIMEEVFGKNHPATAVSYNSIGDVYHNMGKYPKALEFLQNNLAICEEVFGKNHPNTAQSYNNIGDVYHNMGKYPKTLEFHQKALAIMEEVLGKNHPNTAASYNNIGGVYSDMGKYPKALEFHHKALAIMEEVFGKNHPNTAFSYNNIGLVYHGMEDYPKALEFHHKALAIREEVLGKNHPATATSYNNIGLVYHDMEDYPQALEFHHKALAIREEVLVRNHPDTATDYNNIGLVYNSMREYPQALEFHHKALAIMEEVLGKNHPTTATCYNNIGFVYSKMGKYPKALEFYQKALAIREEVLEKNHPDTATSYNGIGDVYYKMGEYPKALEFYQKALAIWEEVLGKNHPDTATCYHNIGTVYSNMSKYPKALEFYQKALAVREEVLGENHPNTVTCYNKIGNVYFNWGDYPNALDFFQKELIIWEEVLGKNHPNTATSYNNIGSVYSSMEDYPQALEFLQKALAIYVEVFGENHPDTIASYNNIDAVYSNIALRLNNIGNDYYNMGDYHKALEFYQKALAIYQEVLGEKHASTAISYNNIGSVYSSMEDYPQALEFYQKALAIYVEVFGENHPDTIACYNNISVVYSNIALRFNNIGNDYYNMGDYHKALEFYQKALAIREEVLGKNHPDTALSYNNIGAVYDNMRDYPKALEFYQKVLAILEEVFGENHPYAATYYNNIGVVYSNIGEYSKALDFYQKALVIWEETNHPDTAICYNKIGDDYSKLGNKEKAEEFRLKAIRADGLLIKNIPAEEQTGELAEAAVRQNGLALQYVADKTLPVCMEALKQNREALEFVPEEFRVRLEAGV
ncbi:DUF2225 domain-containing protein [Breznakiellaceae bacterium SP9]